MRLPTKRGLCLTGPASACLSVSVGFLCDRLALTDVHHVLAMTAKPWAPPPSSRPYTGIGASPAMGYTVLEFPSSIRKNVQASRSCLLDAERIRDSPYGKQASACSLWVRGLSHRLALGGVWCVITVTDFRCPEACPLAPLSGYRHFQHITCSHPEGMGSVPAPWRPARREASGVMRSDPTSSGPDAPNIQPLRMSRLLVGDRRATTLPRRVGETTPSWPRTACRRGCAGARRRSVRGRGQ